jgi:hypothetical protein
MISVCRALTEVRSAAIGQALRIKIKSIRQLNHAFPLTFIPDE